MFRRKKEDSVDYGKLNEGIRIGVDILKIALVLTVVLLVFISGKLLIDWGVLRFLGTLLKVLSPLFIGIVLAWLFDPVVTKLQKKGVNRVLGTLFVYVLLILFIYLLCRLMIPSIAGQLEDLGKSVPNFISYLQGTMDDFFKNLNKMGDMDFTEIQKGVYNSINNLSETLTVDLPTNIMNVATAIISGSVNLLIGLLVGLIDKPTNTAGIPPIYGPIYGIKSVIAQNKPNTIGAFNPTIASAIDWNTNNIPIINKVPFT